MVILRYINPAERLTKPYEMNKLRIIFAALFSFISLLALAQPKVDTTLLLADEKLAYNKVQGYRQRALKGEEVKTLATLYTEDPGSAGTGGAYYNITKGSFVPEFEEAAWALKKPGDISEVFKTTYGFHFVQLISKHEDAVDIRHILIKTNPK